MLEVAVDIYHRPLRAILRETEEFEEFMEVVALRDLQRREADAREAQRRSERSLLDD